MKAIKFLTGIIVAVIIFHLLILCGVIPYNVVWGGKIETKKQMFLFELISMVLNGFLLWILLMEGNFIKVIIPRYLIRFCLWSYLILFVFNTVGNSLAASLFEKFFAIITALSVVLLALILKRNSKLQSLEN